MLLESICPILTIISVSWVDDALGRISQRDNPLSCYLFTESSAIKDYFLPRVVAGGIGVNIPVLHVATPHLPFGGIGASVSGLYHGSWSMRTFIQVMTAL